MICILDVMSGDNAPLELLKGAAEAIKRFDDIKLILVGEEKVIRAVSEKEKIDISAAEIVDAPEVLTMEDNPRAVVAAKKNSSMAIGLKLLAEGRGDAFVSAGNTGALMTGATVYVRNIAGVKRAALATVLPLENPTLLIDSGSNLYPEPEALVQFAVMGGIYMKKQFGQGAARIGLLNNGTEEHKGTKLVQDTYKLLSEDSRVNFIGNVEGKEVPFGKCDVQVCDGFVGNILLKTIEGMGKFIMKRFKGVLLRNALTKLSSLTLLGGLRELKRNFDASEYGGAPFLGISKPVIKAHGSSDAKAIMNAVRQAKVFCDTGLISEIEERLSEN